MYVCMLLHMYVVVVMYALFSCHRALGPGMVNHTGLPIVRINPDGDDPVESGLRISNCGKLIPAHASVCEHRPYVRGLGWRLAGVGCSVLRTDRSFMVKFRLAVLKIPTR
jgi:hypothetical protein